MAVWGPAEALRRSETTFVGCTECYLGAAISGIRRRNLGGRELRIGNQAQIDVTLSLSQTTQLALALLSSLLQRLKASLGCVRVLACIPKSIKSDVRRWTKRRIARC